MRPPAQVFGVLLAPPFLSMWFQIQVLFVFFGSVSSYKKVKKGSCEPIRLQHCQNLHYNQTSYPNIFGHKNQEDAGVELGMFAHIFKMKCSPSLQRFICSLYAPPCSLIARPIVPCRELCLAVKKDCGYLMKMYHLPWPEQTDCDQFPEDDGTCIRYEEEDTEIGSLVQYECPATMKTDTDHFLPMRSGHLTSCGIRCDQIDSLLLDSSSQRVLRDWIRYIGLTGTVICLLTILVFLLDSGRFAYPVRPFVYMNICQFIVGAIYTAGSLSKFNPTCGNDSFLAQGISNSLCTFQASLIYFFKLAAVIWFLIMCVCFLLTTKYTWGSEAFNRLYLIFHYLAWGLPFILTIVVVLIGATVGDSLTGTCSIGNLNPTHLLLFQALPTFFCVISALLILLIALCSSWGIPDAVVIQSERDIRRWKVQIVKFALFGALNSLLVLTNGSLLIVQGTRMSAWIENWFSRLCTSPDRFSKYGFQTDKIYCPEDDGSRPDLLFFLFRYLTQLSVGLLGLIWIFNPKTVRRLWNKLTCSQRRPMI